MYKVYEDPNFQENIKDLLDRKQLEKFENLKDEICEKGFIGKPLKYNFFREKKIRGVRVYF